jgi:hypothetical protein
MRMPEVSEYRLRSTTSTLLAGLARAASHANWKPRKVLPEPPLLLAKVRLSTHGMVGCRWVETEGESARGYVQLTAAEME